MSTMTETGTTTQVHRVFIKATPEAIWEAITTPEWSARYGYRSPNEYDLRPGGRYRGLATEQMRGQGVGEVAVEGEVIEADPPRRLVQTWRMNFADELVAEGFKRLTWEIDDAFPGVSRLTVTHELDGAPQTAAMVSGDVAEAGGGWPMVLSDLKTLLETGESFTG